MSGEAVKQAAPKGPGGRIRAAFGTKRLALAAALVLCTGATYTIAKTSTDRGWQPLVVLAGAGDKAAAMGPLTRFTEINEALLRGLEIDAKTDAFIDDTIESLEDFDLNDFYESLPDTIGPWRRLAVAGEMQGTKYKVVQGKGKFEVSRAGNRKDLADSSMVVRAQPLKRGDDNTYLMHTRFGVGIGDLAWGEIVDAGETFLRVASGERPDGGLPPSNATLAAVKEAFPKLQDDDVVLIGMMWDAFPESSKLFASLGSIDDVVSDPAPDGSYTHIRLKARISKRKMRRKYKELSKFLGNFDKLMKANITWKDSKNRYLMKTSVNTNGMRSTIEVYIKDGKLLPFGKKGKVYGTPIDPMGPALAKSSFVIDAVSEVMGLKIKINRLVTTFNYKPTPYLASASGSAKRMPKMKIEGAAMGFISTRVIDFFIPGNIEQIMTDFVGTALQGNNGRGVAMAMYLGKDGANAPGLLETTMGVQILNNFFVKMGMSIVADRIVPDDDAIDDIYALLRAAHDGFTHDVKRYAKMK